MDSGRRVLCLLPGTVGNIENQPQEIWRVGRSVSYLSPSGSVQIANNLLPLAEGYCNHFCMGQSRG